jgi:hypothetical protein
MEPAFIEGTEDEGVTMRLAVRELGACTVAPLPFGTELWSVEEFEQPWRTNYWRFASVLIAGALEEDVTPEQVERLSDHSRARLRRALVTVCELEGDYRRLRGSHLSLDERLYAVFLWRFERFREKTGRLVASGMSAVGRALVPTVESLAGQFQRVARSVIPPAVEGLVRGGDRLLAGVPVERLTAAHVQLDGLVETLEGQGYRRAVALGIPRNPLRAPKLPEGLFQGFRVGGQVQTLRGAGGLAPRLGLLEDPNFQRAVRSFTLRRGSNLALPPLQVPPLPAEGFFSRLGREVQEWVADFAEASAFLRQWQGRPLWFFISLLTWRQAKPLVGLEGVQLEEALLRGLAEAIRDEDLSQALNAAIEQAPYLTPSQRENLQHGLEHARGRQWVRACSPLLDGLEGAFWRAARGQAVITPERGLVSRPTKPVHSVETLFKLLRLDPEYRSFLVRHVFGEVGNVFRHGDAEGGERREVLLGLVALCGWLDLFAGVPATRALASRVIPEPAVLEDPTG